MGVYPPDLDGGWGTNQLFRPSEPHWLSTTVIVAPATLQGIDEEVAELAGRWGIRVSKPERPLDPAYASSGPRYNLTGERHAGLNLVDDDYFEMYVDGQDSERTVEIRCLPETDRPDGLCTLHFDSKRVVARYGILIDPAHMAEWPEIVEAVSDDVDPLIQSGDHCRFPG